MNPTSDTPEKASIAPPMAPAIAKAPSQKKEKKPVAKKAAPKKSKDGVNKSEEIRTLAKELQAKGEKVRPVTIVKALKAEGITVAPPQVSVVLKGMGFKRRKQRRTASAKAPVAKKTSKSTLSVEDLIKAKKLVNEFGGAERLVNAITALGRLQ